MAFNKPGFYYYLTGEEKTGVYLSLRHIVLVMIEKDGSISLTLTTKQILNFPSTPFHTDKLLKLIANTHLD